MCAAKPELVSQLLEAKEATGKTFTQIAQEVKLTNLYTAQLFHNQVWCRRFDMAALSLLETVPASGAAPFSMC